MFIKTFRNGILSIGDSQIKENLIYGQIGIDGSAFLFLKMPVGLKLYKINYLDPDELKRIHEFIGEENSLFIKQCNFQGYILFNFYALKKHQTRVIISDIMFDKSNNYTIFFLRGFEFSNHDRTFEYYRMINSCSDVDVKNTKFSSEPILLEDLTPNDKFYFNRHNFPIVNLNKIFFERINAKYSEFAYIEEGFSKGFMHIISSRDSDWKDPFIEDHIIELYEKGFQLDKDALEGRVDTEFIHFTNPQTKELLVYEINSSKFEVSKSIEQLEPILIERMKEVAKERGLDSLYVILNLQD